MDKALNRVIKRQIVLAALSGVAIICLMLTITYGLYQKNHTNTIDQEIAVGDFDVDLTSNSGQITLADLKPGDAPNTSYTFTTSNSGDYIVNYNVYLTDNTTTFMQDSTNASTYSGYTSITSENYQYINFQINDGVIRPLSDVYNSTTNKFNILGGILVPDETYTYSIKFSVASNAPNSIQGNILALNITMDAAATDETGVGKIRQLATGSNTSSVNVITKTPPSGASCTNTLAYDGTPDANLRFVGADPCNYVSFNNESWRIIGVMNNIDDGTGKLEARLKLIRATSLAYHRTLFYLIKFGINVPPIPNIA